jgi:acyl-CoA synthetase (AMP-forming)/AMP-acid ligase II
MVRPGDVISMDRWSAEGAVELCRRHGAETLAGTSLYFHAMGSVAQDLGGVRGGIAGGGPVAPAIVRSLDQDGIRLVRAYGSTEHPTITQSLPNDPLAARALTDGRPCQGVELRLLDEHGVEVPAGVAGEIFSRGPDAMAGYLDAATDAECYSEDDWFRTGDIGTVDVDGRLTISDRVKDIIIRGGENISAKEVEDALHDWSAIEEVAVIGVPDPQYGERGCAFLIPAAGVITVAEMRAYLAGTPLEKYKWPEFVVVVDGFPRTASGKVRKQTLREQWGRTNVVGQGSAR